MRHGWWALAIGVAGWASAALAQSPADGRAPSPQKQASPAASNQEPGGERAAVGARTLRDLEYARPDGKPVRLDLYLPAESAMPAPVVIWIHGGGWQAGTKAICPARPLVKDGFAVASVEYRLTDRGPFPAQIEDCKAAVRYLRAHAKEYNLDPERFGCWGASAGGHLVALLGTTCGDKACEGAELGNADVSSGVQCVCDWFGPTDFTAFTEPRADVAPMLVKLFGGRMSDKQDLVKLASPALHVKKGQPPFLIVQGDQDPLVPQKQSEILAGKLKEAGVPVELVIVKGAGHGFAGEQLVTELKRVKEFFVKNLKGRAAVKEAGRGGGESRPG